MLVYDLTNATSFKELDNLRSMFLKWAEPVLPSKLPFIVVGMKLDLLSSDTAAAHDSGHTGSKDEDDDDKVEVVADPDDPTGSGPRQLLPRQVGVEEVREWACWIPTAASAKAMQGGSEAKAHEKPVGAVGNADNARVPATAILLECSAPDDDSVRRVFQTAVSETLKYQRAVADHMLQATSGAGKSEPVPMGCCAVL